MLRYRGGEKVIKGTYWNPVTGERIEMEHEGVLPGESSTIYLRMPAPFVLIIGPVLGLLYAIFLPLITILMVVGVIAMKVFGAISRLAWSISSFGWRLTEAYLGGRRSSKKKGSKDPG